MFSSDGDPRSPKTNNNFYLPLKLTLSFSVSLSLFDRRRCLPPIAKDNLLSLSLSLLLYPSPSPSQSPSPLSVAVYPTPLFLSVLCLSRSLSLLERIGDIGQDIEED
ncbi:unnamed protein product [Camellia sinensis]